MNPVEKDGIFKNLRYDLPASVVVFLVAVPLFLGIALASGAPLFSGIIAGIVGGIVVGLLSGSQLGVSGPAAGLAVIVLASIQELEFAEDVTFLNKASIQRTLKNPPANSKVVIDGSKTINIDQDVVEIIQDFETNAKYKNIELEMIALESVQLPCEITEVEKAIHSNGKFDQPSVPVG